MNEKSLARRLVVDPVDAFDILALLIIIIGLARFLCQLEQVYLRHTLVVVQAPKYHIWVLYMSKNIVIWKTPTVGEFCEIVIFLPQTMKLTACRQPTLSGSQICNYCEAINSYRMNLNELTKR